MSRATTIFHNALEIAVEKRSDFLAEACAVILELMFEAAEPGMK